MKFFYGNSKNAAIGTLIDLQFNLPIDESISLAIFQRKICYPFNYCESKKLGVGDFNPSGSFSVKVFSKLT